MLEENLGKQLVISRTITQALHHLTFPAPHLCYFKQQLFTLMKVFNWWKSSTKSKLPKACSHSQAHRNTVFPCFLFRFLDLLPSCHEWKKTCPTVTESNKAYIYFRCLLFLSSLGRKSIPDIWVRIHRLWQHGQWNVLVVLGRES